MPGTQRLTSYRLPRDLTLGGSVKPEKPKKVYVPNLNVQRTKKKDEATPVQIDAPKLKDTIDRGRGRGRGNSRHGRDKGNIIQSAGIWSEGVFAAPTVSRRSYSSSSSNTGAEKYLQKTKLNTKKINVEEEEKLKNLLCDDFMDDSTIADKMDPISLPRVIKEEFSDEEIDKKPIISESGEVINIKKEILNEKNRKEVTIPQIIENKTNPYVLMQLADCWQNLESSKEESKSEGSTDANTDKSDDNTKSENCGLNSLKSGLLGKIEILKSGKARLCLGDKRFSIDINVQQDFQQELLAAKVDTVSLTGDLINLGSVNNQLICLPDVETILKNS
ncbi:DNA-directed RNA polymerase III subunit RPC4 [Camponotus japonicus]